MPALPEQRAEREPLAARHAERLRETHQHGELDRDQPGDEQRQQPGPRDHFAEVDRHADADEEQAEQQALERLDVGLERAAVFGARRAARRR